MKLLFAAAFVGLFSVALAWSCANPCLGNMCCSVAADGNYFLTDFCAGYPQAPVSCGGTCANQGKYFTADRQRYGCGKYLNVCARGKCVKAKVIDAGPALWVEEKANGPIIDASPAVCQDLFGHSSCGWSDHLAIHVAVAADVTDDSQLGPWIPTPEQYDAIIAESRASADNLAAPIGPAQCCTPAQWEGYEFSYDPERHFRAGFNISYDFTNKRTRVVIEERGNGPHRRIFETIALWNEKKLYEIDHSTGNCRTVALNEPMVPDCIPTNAKHLAAITIGETLNANVWGFQITNNNMTVDIVVVRSAANCIPIDSVVMSQRFGIDHNNFWDITSGIKNPAVFTPPSNCAADNRDKAQALTTKVVFALAKGGSTWKYHMAH